MLSSYRADEGMEAHYVLRRDRPTLGPSLSQHADARHRARLRRHRFPRRHKRLRGPGNDKAVRDYRRAVDRTARPRRGARLIRTRRCRFQAPLFHAGVGQIRKRALRRNPDPRHGPARVPVRSLRRGDRRHCGEAPSRPLPVERAAVRIRVTPSRRSISSREARLCVKRSKQGRTFPAFLTSGAPTRNAFARIERDSSSIEPYEEHTNRNFRDYPRRGIRRADASSHRANPETAPARFSALPSSN